MNYFQYLPISFRFKKNINFYIRKIIYEIENILK